ncbi:MAG: hypothetical protein IKX23_00525 [Treponema sp.]|nr:hypothetical protein [Treponema sp.]
MNKRFILLLMSLLIGTGFLFAEKSFDNALRLASDDIAEKCEINDIIVINDFTAPSEQMTIYIREQLGDLIYAKEGLIKIVTRDKIAQQFTEHERYFQNSGSVDEKTVLSVAKKLGAKLVVFGSFEELNNMYMLRVRMLSVETDSYIFRKTYEFARSSKTEQLLGRSNVYYKASAGFEIELNKNSLDYLAPGGAICFDYALSRKFTVGGKFFVSYDYYENKTKMYVAEAVGGIRVYLVSPSGEPVTGFFVEGHGGVSLVFLKNDCDFSENYGGGFGFRFGLRGVYLEPVVRIGYPYMFGAGITAGFRF